ncbi:SIS domain-containing protein [Polymorphobacter fuscus]|uniref:SIS domain-containing protein n=1 Tax=Sandarakinorhabdus fusca TaxID=1439888 RepID=A0A7C9KLN3_9SPHN|nr:SIS domain-containing protein [Polymorphobacter fuscus]KAB7647937.1 SIS domain-containing protein [Polymorphobacter fuscus]MQT17263.1 SIS domain-containing protein [Polymorphobacter fuscus]NJC08742.1 glucosamine--fructose-6-phosphate aminotransferase (isomerizing) [Polymorphobacter fuscus]
MARETQAAPALCAAQIVRNAALMRATGARLRALAPPFAATLARGSSDNAAGFAKVLLETRAAMPVLSQAPSIGSIYKATSPRFAGVPLLAISQSGRSPDLIAAARDAQRQGALVVAIVNDTESALAALADICIPVHMGPEISVAATKSFVGTLVAIIHLVAEWTEDAELLALLPQIAPVLAAAEDWRAAVPLLRDVSSMLVLGRGLTLPIAGEAALKLKETSGIHAEAFSSAEVAHGPMTLVGDGVPVLAFGATDAARAGLHARLTEFRARGTQVIAAGHPDDTATATLALPLPWQAHPLLAALAAIQSFYGLAEALALARGLDPDRPPHLSKVTHTL